MPPKKASKFRNKLSLSDKIELLTYYNKTKCSFRKLAQQFNIGKTQASQIIKKQNVLFELWLSDGNAGDRCTRISSVGLQVDKLVHDWYLEMKSENMNVTGPMIQNKALEFSRNFGSDFKASNGWLAKFLKRHRIKFQELKRKKHETKPVETKTDETKTDETKNGVNICEWLKHLAVILPKFSADDIFSAVQTGLFFKSVPDDAANLINETCLDGERSDVRFSILFCTSMSGIKEKPLVVTNNSENELDNLQLPDVLLESNSNVWLTKDIMINWLEQLDSRMIKEKRNIVMFLNHTLPYHNFELKNIKVIYFPPCLSSENYPVNQSIIQNFKILYRLHMLKHLIMLKENDENNLPSNVTVSKAQALNWINTAWKELSESVIQKCYEDLCFNTYVTIDKVNDSDKFITLNDVSDLLCAYDSFVSAVDYVSIDDNLITVEDQKSNETFIQNIKANDISFQNNDEIHGQSKNDLTTGAKSITTESNEIYIDNPKYFYFESLENLKEIEQFYLTQNDSYAAALIKQLISHHEKIINKKWI